MRAVWQFGVQQHGDACIAPEEANLVDITSGPTHPGNKQFPEMEAAAHAQCLSGVSYDGSQSRRLYAARHVWP